MAEIQAPAFFMVALPLLLFAAATPTAYGEGGLLSNLLTGINLSSRLCCSSDGDGNCNGTTPGISGVVVSLYCPTGLGGASVIVGQGVTSVNGAFNISVGNIIRTLGITLTSLLGVGLPCPIFVDLPLNQTDCPILNNATGFIVSVPTLLNAVVSPTLGLVANLSVQSFVNVNFD